MSNFPTIRLVPLQSAIEEVSNHPRPFVVVNLARHTAEYLEFPNGMFEKLPDGFAGDLLVAPTTLAELNGAGIPPDVTESSFSQANLSSCLSTWCMKSWTAPTAVRPSGIWRSAPAMAYG
jgi:hypothetical protein